MSRQIPHRVYYYVDYLDPNPTVTEFDTEWEALEFISEEVARITDHIVQHSPHPMSEQDIEHIQEIETLRFHIEVI